MSSGYSCSPKTGIGSSLASDKSSIDLIDTSILPVFKSKFSVPFALPITLPNIFKTDSGFAFSKIGKKIYYCFRLRIE